MARIVVIGDLMTDTVAHATLPLARGSAPPAKVTTPGGGSGANVAAWAAADGADVAFIGRRGADIAGRNRDMELMGYGVDGGLVVGAGWRPPDTPRCSSSGARRGRCSAQTAAPRCGSPPRRSKESSTERERAMPS